MGSSLVPVKLACSMGAKLEASLNCFLSVFCAQRAMDLFFPRQQFPSCQKSCNFSKTCLCGGLCQGLFFPECHLNSINAIKGCSIIFALLSLTVFEPPITSTSLHWLGKEKKREHFGKSTLFFVHSKSWNSLPTKCFEFGDCGQHSYSAIFYDFWDKFVWKTNQYS